MSEIGPSNHAPSILVVDDESSIRSVLHTFLVSKGYRVLAAASGTEALELCQAHPEPFDLVVTDMVMPGIAGAELVQRLLDKQSTLRVIYMSGYADEPERPEPADRVLALFLRKPFPMQEFHQYVQALLPTSPASSSEA